MSNTQDRTVELGRYTFNEAKHLHQLDGKALTGVTTILGVIAKPALIQWSANMACDYIESKASLVKIGGGYASIEDFVTVIKEARSAHRIKKEKAGDLGTAVHAIVEELIKKAVSENQGVIKETTHENTQVQHFLDWATKNKVKFLESEMNVWSEKMWIGGICDIICEIDGNLWIGDIKTSTGIYEEAFFQMAAYDMCLEEMGNYTNPIGYIVLNLRKDGGFEEKRSVSNEDNREAFKAALTLYRIKEKIKNLIK